MRRLKTIIIAALLIIAMSDTSKAEFNKAIDSGIVISGTMLDLNTANNPDYVSSISIMVSKTPFPFIEMRSVPNKKFVLKCKERDTFKVNIPNVSKVNYLYISYSMPAYAWGLQLKTSWIDNVYLINAGDSIFCKLKADARIFTGKGAEKLQCQQELYALKYQPSAHIAKLLENEKTFLSGLDLLDQKCDSVFKRQLKVIKKYRSKLDKSILNVMYANCIGYRYYSVLRGMSGEKWNNRLKLLYKSRYFNKIDQQTIGINDSDLALSPIYASVLLQKIMIKGIFDHESHPLNNTDELKLARCYKLIKTHYTGMLKDKLTTLLVLRSKTAGLKLIGHILNDITTPLYKSTLTKVLITNSKGKRFSNYKLMNTKGEEISLSLFNDKVVLLDFWYTGCLGCIRMNKALSPVYEKFKDNPGVAFVSVSIDRNLDMWKQSVETGNYTSVYGIHLNTGVLETTHPIITENLIGSYPTFLILKNGKLYSSIPPVPKQPNDLDGIQKLCDVINKALID